METITTITQAIDHLVANGIAANLARAAIIEQYGGGDDDLLFDAGEQLVVTSGPCEILEVVWETYVDQLEVTNEGILFDGELTFDLDGNYL